MHSAHGLTDSWWFSCVDTIGSAAQEQALKRLPWWLRHRARMFVWENQADWGHFRQLEARKGVPPTGFAVGTVAELQDQAWYGGVRLPGAIYMRTGRSSHETQYDLSGLPEDVLCIGCLVRVRSRVFRVEAIGPRKLTFDRKVRRALFAPLLTTTSL
jgi:hypothetical protein